MNIIKVFHLALFSLLLSTQCAALREQERKNWSASAQEWKGKSLEDFEEKTIPVLEIVEEPKPMETFLDTTYAISKSIVQDSLSLDSTLSDTILNNQIIVIKDSLDLQDSVDLANSLFLGLISEAMWDELFPSRIGKGKNDPRTDFYSFTAFKEACSHFPKFL
ncbi:MAG: hypothetical protein ACRCSB_05840, partial [Bacteroidales bacterium]